MMKFKTAEAVIVSCLQLHKPPFGNHQLGIEDIVIYNPSSTLTQDPWHRLLYIIWICQELS